MIQRIQSVFLLLTSLLMGATVFCPLMEFRDDSREIVQIFYSTGIGSDFPTWGVLTFAVVSALLALVNIFLYKKRKVQINIGYVTALFIILYYATSFVYVNAFMGKTDFTVSVANVQYGIVLPLIALIFDFLAISKIKKDEKLVKSLDRIR
ncbi:DUF4293 domain-containing protein [Prevotella sp. 10(H)]|uniref:DUF4293 domain-containing protein n=1 Tax=Prevotella sp. 10(H) TaxID=1158294 RepID=UPI0004A7634B|nr:DUF4293 domain-containing protein [Prevotella sp. 10(H)]